MTDYISREMTIDAICRLCNANFEEDPCEPSECEMMSLLRKIPAADVRPVVRKPVVGYEGLYFVTNDGEVTNADGVVMKQHAKKGNGTCYKSVSLYNEQPKEET